jgi:peptide deformylase
MIRFFLPFRDCSSPNSRPTEILFSCRLTPQRICQFVLVGKTYWDVKRTKIMSIRPILRFGDPRLLVKCDPVALTRNSAPADVGQTYAIPGDVTALVADLRATMADASGAGIAAPQIGVTRRVVLFGTGAVNPRYPDAEIVPRTAIINPLSIPLTRAEFARAAVALAPTATDSDVTAAADLMRLFDLADAASDAAGAAEAAAAIEAESVRRTAALAAARVTASPTADVAAEEDEYMQGFEGCLSVPGLRGSVERHRYILYQGVCADTGLRIRRAGRNFHARVFQHECDHLDGFVFPMRVKDWSLFGYVAELEARGLVPPLPVAPAPKA